MFDEYQKNEENDELDYGESVYSDMADAELRISEFLPDLKSSNCN